MVSSSFMESQTSLFINNPENYLCLASKGDAWKCRFDCIDKSWEMVSSTPFDHNLITTWHLIESQTSLLINNPEFARLIHHSRRPRICEGVHNNSKPYQGCRCWKRLKKFWKERGCVLHFLKSGNKKTFYFRVWSFQKQ